MSMARGGARPKNTLPLLTSAVKLDADDPATRCALRVVSPEGSYTLQAESELERAEWVAALQAVIGCLLNGGASMASTSRSSRSIWFHSAAPHGTMNAKPANSQSQKGSE